MGKLGSDAFMIYGSPLMPPGNLDLGCPFHQSLDMGYSRKGV